MTVPRRDIHAVLDHLAVPSRRLRVLRDANDGGNGNWRVALADGRRYVLRRYWADATRAELEYEHAVLAHVAAAGWHVPQPASPLLEYDGRWFCLTEFVGGRGRARENAAQRRQRGADLARLQFDMRDLAEQLGQRPGWQPQHRGTSTRTNWDWPGGILALAGENLALAEWAQAAAEAAAEELAALGARDLPLTLVHGDFAEWNVHYEGGSLVGVIDFGLAHVDSRPYELAIARTYRAPEVRDGYRAELARLGWPLTELEERLIEPLHHAFRIAMVAFELSQGVRSGHFDAETIQRQLERTGIPTWPR